MTWEAFDEFTKKAEDVCMECEFNNTTCLNCPVQITRDKLENEIEDDYAELDQQFAAVSWCIEDITSIANARGQILTKARAADWWKRNESWFRDALIAYGNEILANTNFTDGR